MFPMSIGRKAFYEKLDFRLPLAPFCEIETQGIFGLTLVRVLRGPRGETKV